MEEQFEKIRVIVSLVFEKNGKFLLSRQSPNASRGVNCWGFPGGHVELGEKLKEACLREAKEELGVEVKVGEMIGYFEYINEYIQAPKHVLALFFRCQLENEKFSPGGDIDKVEWVAKEDFKNYELRPLMKEALAGNLIEKFLSS